MANARTTARWSWRVAEVAGIGIYIHVTLLLLMLWIAVGSAVASGDALRAVTGVIRMALIFACVALHELGHALAARRYGIRTLDIVLLPFGGIARLERMPEKPAQEIVVALAGPAVNVVISLVLIGGLALTGAPGLAAADLRGGLLPSLLAVNLLMVGFNLIPAFPMDGGRVLRALLAFRLPFVRATEVAATVGQAIALIFGIIGLFGNPMLVFIALFVFLAASEEGALVQNRNALAGLPVGAVMITSFATLEPRDRLGRAVDLLMHGDQQDFPVLEGDRLIGILTRPDLLVGLKERGPDAAVGDVVVPDSRSAAPNEALEVALPRLNESGRGALPVMTDGRLVGILTSQNVAEFLMVRSALARRRGSV